jgi:Flp pilus assembly protein TadG
MVRRQPCPRQRKAVAAVEFAFILPLLLTFILGVWDFGRLIQVEQALNNAAREGARLAAQGLIINPNGVPTQVYAKHTGGTYNVEDTVKNYLAQAGYDTTNLNVTFTFLTGNTTLTDPYQASKGQRYQVTVTLPFSNVNWTVMNVTGIQTMGASVVWESLVDDPFTLNTTLPTW